MIRLIPDWEQAVIPLSATIREAIDNLNSTGLQIVLVVNSERGLVGTITDGDIRREFLEGGELEAPIVDCICRNPVTVGPNLGKQSIEAVMRKEQVQHLPVVDQNHTLVGLHRLSDFAATPPRPNLVVIMAGGEGLRMRPYTESCPKPMLPVEGRPILEHILERAISQGFNQFVITVHYLSHMIVDHFGDGESWDATISYLHEEELLGTAGGLALLETLPDSPIVVANGDVLTSVSYADMIEFHESHEAWGSMAVRLHEWRHPFGVVTTEGVDIVDFKEKPSQLSHVNAGVYVLSPAAIPLLTGDRLDMPGLFDSIRTAGGRTIVFPIHEPWVDAGHMEDYERISRELDEGTRFRPQIDIESPPDER